MVLPSGLTLSGDQRATLRTYADELKAMNRRINLVSREDVERIASRHVPHCLTLAIRSFRSGSTVVDWGTGGGLPLIPLAVTMPDVSFIGVDAVSKKVQAVKHFARRLGLDNVDAWHGRAEAFGSPVDYSVSRATAPLDVLWHWHRRVVRDGAMHVSNEKKTEGASDYWPSGSLVCLKGGELEPEIDRASSEVEVLRWPIANLLPDPYFQSKEIVCAMSSRSHG